MENSNGRTSATRLDGFEDFVRTTLEAWNVPGAAVAIVADGNVIFSAGLGLRDVGSALSATTRTLFPIASCTKAFTATTLGIMVDEGKLDWDTPVKAYFPSLKLYDPVATERITPRDLLTHRSGLPRHDFVWYNGTRSRRELVDSLRYLEPSQDLRTAYQYNNLMFMLAGYLVEQLTGQTWEEFTRQRIFEPLGMANSLFSVHEAQQTPDFASPYREEDDEVRPIAFYGAQDAIAPAGAIVSNVADLAKWILLQLNGGRQGDQRIISASQLAQIHSPQMVIKESSRYSELPALSTYGLGWVIHTYRGHTAITHTGGIDGFSSRVAFLPSEGLGIAILTNLHGAAWAHTAIAFNAIDRLLGLDQIHWNDRYKEERSESKRAEETKKVRTESDRVMGTAPSHPLASYVGGYAHPGYGIFSVSLGDDALTATFNGMTGPLVHYHYDVFTLQLGPDAPLTVCFSTNARGDVVGVAVPFESVVGDIVFRRLPPREMTERSLLESLAGEYEWSDRPIAVTVKDKTSLLLSLPWQPPIEMIPYRQTEFVARNLSGYSIEFVRDSAGLVREVIVTLPNAVLTARRQGTVE